MRTLLDIFLCLGAMTAYLAGVYAFAQYRRARVGDSAYRAERDWAVTLATAVVPGLLAVLLYFFSRI